MKRDALPFNLAPRGLSRAEVAAYLGIGQNLFDQMVKDGRMPQPGRINGRVIWDRLAVDRAMDNLFELVTDADDPLLRARL